MAIGRDHHDCGSVASPHRIRLRSGRGTAPVRP
ncbi:MAG: hypothetical protein HOP15_15660 [Planctomycetes bacterium]|nr:hypothetical protein [Planctomycetota bacterium]